MYASFVVFAPVISETKIEMWKNYGHRRWWCE